jgi:hypothetical protein
MLQITAESCVQGTMRDTHVGPQLARTTVPVVLRLLLDSVKLTEMGC